MEFTALFLLICMLVTCRALTPPIGPPPIQCVQGNDDQVMSLHLLQNNQLPDLKLRYATVQQQLTPGNRRYNLFWSEFESTAPASAPIACPPGTQLIPTNEVGDACLRESSFVPRHFFCRPIAWPEATTGTTATTTQRCRSMTFCLLWMLPSAASALPSFMVPLTTPSIPTALVFLGPRTQTFASDVCPGTISTIGRTT